MRIFLSYAGEHRKTADALALRLRQSGHDVFFDKDHLPPAQSYDDRIRAALSRSDALVFLVSPESVASGAYTLTEMELARDRWENPSGHVLPVVVAPTRYEDIPPYLKAVTVLEPRGNVIAEADAAVRAMAGRGRKVRIPLLAAAVVATALGGAYLVRDGLQAPKTTVRGRVTDVESSGPVAGATVEVRCGRSVVADGVTDADGTFVLDVPSCEPAATLTVSHALYTDQSQLLDGIEQRVAMMLLPHTLRTCRIADSQGVVVGHFRPPVSAPESGSDLASRIADALTYDVLTVVQTLNLPPSLQPRFVACDEASPRSLDSAPVYARALGADAFLMGDVEPADGAFTVKALIGDAFQLFRPPLRSTTSGVTLNDPGAARMAPDMHAAILTAVARGLAERNRFSECIDMAVAAERLFGERPPALAETLARCQGGTALNELRRGDS